MQLREPLYKLIIRFGNGEMINHIVSEPIESRHIASDTRYAIISCFALQNPSECTDITVVNLRDVTFIKTERVTLDQVGTERRMIPPSTDYLAILLSFMCGGYGAH